MKILVISHHKEQSASGKAARELLLAMKSAGLDVVARAVKLGLVGEVSKEIQELEEKSSDGCDICVQYLLPHHMRFDGSFKKCIAYFDYEMDNFQSSGWTYSLDAFPEIWVASQESFRQLVQSGIKKEKISIVPHSLNLKEFEGPFNKIVRGDTSYKFLFVGDSNERKGLKDLILAFHSEFYVDEPVSLVIKTSKHGLSPKQTKENITNYINNIKVGMRIYPSPQSYKQEVIITERLTDKQMLDLHFSCNCLVFPSHGESFGYPIIESLAMGRPVVTNDIGAAPEFMIPEIGYLCNSTKGPVHGMMDAFPHLGTGLELWSNIDIEDLKYGMRQLYSSVSNPDLCKKAVQKFDNAKVGLIIKGLLCSQ